MTRSTTKRGVERAALLVLVLFASALCLYYSRFGIMPLDESIVFDGGWRILSGQRPFVDFTAPAGIVPSVMQAALFKAFGVSWFVYALHAALINALFAAIAFRTMRDLGAGFWPAWTVALGSAVIFYTPFGLPYLEQHSFFFSLACLWAVVAVMTDSPHKPLAIVTAPTLAVLALLSKQIPALFLAVPSVVVLAVAAWPRERRRLAAGAAFPALAALAYAAVTHLSVRHAAYYTFTLPSQVASTRLTWRRIVRTEGAWQTLLPGNATTMTLVLGGGVVLVWAVQAVRRGAGQLWRKPVGVASLALALVLVTALFVTWTDNHVANGVGLLALAVGLAWLAADLTVERAGFVRQRYRGAARVGLAAVVAVVSVFSLWDFNQTINARRAVHEGGFNPALQRWSPGGRLRFLVVNQESYEFDMRDALIYITSRDDNFFLFGDSSLLYGATGHPSLFPALWIHPGLTIPPAGTGEFREFERTLLNNIDAAHARYIIREGSRTRTGARLEDFPQLAARVAGCPRTARGGWTILEICR